jgi:hypothetical protein
MGDQAMRHGEPHHAGKWHQEWKQGPEEPGFIRRQISWHEDKEHEQRKQKYEHRKGDGGDN